MTIIQLEAELALAAQTELGEGPVWDERSQELYFVDITAHRVHAFAPESGAHRSFETNGPVGAVVLRDDGGLVLAGADGFFFASPDGTGLQRFGEFRIDIATVRFNDGKVSPGGHFLAGTMDHHEELTVGSLYILKADGTVSVLLDPVSISNGLAWDADGTTFYYIDTPTHRIDAFSFGQGTGELSNRRAVAEITDGAPDGMAIDAEGYLWVACWGGSRVDRIDPADGRRVATVPVPTSHVSSVAFGGHSLEDLYITTARHNLSPAQLAAQPHAGDLFVARTGTPGLAPDRFKTP
jgi:sugar lactone lactonase YvrE